MIVAFPGLEAMQFFLLNLTEHELSAAHKNLNTDK